MKKEDRLKWIKQRHEELMDIAGDMPISPGELHEEVESLESYREYTRDKKTSKDALTSDEG